MQPVTLTPFEYSLVLAMLGVIGFFFKKFSNDVRDKEMDLSRSIEKLNTSVETLTTVMHRMEQWVAAEFVRKVDHKEDIGDLQTDLRATETRLVDMIREGRR
jgi:hypothetical protein